MWISLKPTFIFLKFLLNSRLAVHLLVGNLEVTVLHLLQFSAPRTGLITFSLDGTASQPQVSSSEVSALITPSDLPHRICYEFLYFSPLLSFCDPCFPFDRLCSCFQHLLTSWLAMISKSQSLQSFPGLVHGGNSGEGPDHGTLYSKP